ncbi:MAG: UDP-N-acetylmuramoyl-tripeptide--D-alanyl-D-alanine ligase [Pseudazoarcus pumilus]|nr:UDP-N-acetylmuramoyl-tripeptide--D-alanyl-D-alanine ligase [Pseudazoarcus pumilus]
MRVDELRDALGAELRGSGEVRFEMVGSDSRAVKPGMLFVALRGERFDAHDFVAEALASGAVAGLVERAALARVGEVSGPLLVVEDTRAALARMAAHWRARFDIPLIGVTGSNGKTTVKDMCTSILRAAFGADAVLATQGNLNNDLGLPLTLLGLREGHRAAVIEMGMNHPGEIAALAAIARPTVAIVTNAQRAHLQGMGSLDEVAREKGSIFVSGCPEAVAVINADDAYADYWRGIVAGRRVLSFGLERDADVRGRASVHGLGARVELQSFAGRASITLGVPGEHNVRNALGAAAACLAAGIALPAVVAGLEAFGGTRGRLQQKTGPRGAVLIDDSYNANPDSVRAAIDVLAALPGRRVLVLGDMGEVGEISAQVHDEVGGYAKSKGVEALYALGEMSVLAARNFGDGAQHFSTPEALVAALLPRLDADSVVLVKGSRFMRMERVVEALLAAAKGENDAA